MQKSRNRKCKFEYNLNIFTDENALSYYLLGVFITDGCVNKRKNRHGYRVTLSSVDKEWIESIRDLICPEMKVTKDKRANCYSFCICHQKIAQWLIYNGCIPQKSLILEFPKTIPEKYISDFLRGVVDGDGSLSSKKRVISICSGSYNFINSIKLFFDNKKIHSNIYTQKPNNRIIKAKGREFTQKNNLYVISSCGENANILCKNMYYPGAFCLNRKLILANEIISYYNNCNYNEDGSINRNGINSPCYGEKSVNFGIPRPEELKLKVAKKISGTDNGNAKLNWEIVDEIRLKYENGYHNFYGLSKQFGVAITTIKRIINNEGWKIERKPVKQ